MFLYSYDHIWMKTPIKNNIHEISRLCQMLLIIIKKECLVFLSTFFTFITLLFFITY